MPISRWTIFVSKLLTRLTLGNSWPLRDLARCSGAREIKVASPIEVAYPLACRVTSPPSSHHHLYSIAMSTFSDRPTSWIHVEGREEGFHRGFSGFNEPEWRSTGQVSTTSLAHMSAPASSSSYSWQPLAWEPSPTGGLQSSLPNPGLVDGAVSPTTISAPLPYGDQRWPTKHQPHPAPTHGWEAYSQHPPSSSLQSPSCSPSAPYEVALASPPTQVFTLPINPPPRRPIPLRRKTTTHVKAEPPLPSSASSAVASSNASSLTQPQQRWSLHSHPASYQVLRPTPFDAYGPPPHPSPPPALASASSPGLWAPEQHNRAQSWDGSSTAPRSQAAQYGWDALAACLPLVSPGLPGAPSDLPPPSLVAVVDNARGSWSYTDINTSPLPGPSAEAWEHSPAAAVRPELYPPPLGSSLGLTELSDTPSSPPLSSIQAAVKAKVREANSLKRPRKPKRRKSEATSSNSAPRKHVCELCHSRVAFSRPSALRTHLVSYIPLYYRFELR